MAAYNLYRGNGSRAERIGTQSEKSPVPRQPKPAAPAKQLKSSAAALPFLGAIPKKLGELEMEDLMLILILYLMYRESGDRELLIIMGAMYLL